MSEEATSTPTAATTNDKPATSYAQSIPTLEVGISIAVATVANRFPNHPGYRELFTSIAPLIGVIGAFLTRILAALLLRGISINAAKKSYKEALKELKDLPADQSQRRKQIEKRIDEKHTALDGLRREKLDMNVIK